MTLARITLVVDVSTYGATSNFYEPSGAKHGINISGRNNAYREQIEILIQDALKEFNPQFESVKLVRKEL